MQNCGEKIQDKWLCGKILSSRIYPEFFPFDKNDRIINVGCGNGPQAIVYAGNYKEMVGVDINEERLKKSEGIIRGLGIDNYKTLRADVESIPLENESFDKAIAIDIIEHVKNPGKLCAEICRLIKKDGELLITFPAMHDKFVDFVSKLGKVIKNKSSQTKTTDWHPDNHNNKYPPEKWIEILEKNGFKLLKSRATTMFPPLHLYGLPRFWFSNEFIHKIDGAICKRGVIKNYGQTLACVFKK